MSEDNLTYRESSDLPGSDFDNDANIYIFKTEFTRRVLPVSIVFGLTACAGIVANALVVYVYGFRYKQCNFKYFLFMMGVIGIVQCFIMLPIQIAEMHYWFSFPTSWLCRASAYVFGYTVILCYSVLLLIATDRFRKVCRPHGWQIQFNTARNLCAAVSLGSLFFALPPGIISGHHSFTTRYNGSNITVTVCATDDMYQNRDWAVYFLLMFGGIPVSIVIVITCALYCLILKQFYQGPSLNLQSFYHEPRNRVTSSTPQFDRAPTSKQPITASGQHTKKIPRSPKIAPILQKRSSSAASLRNTLRSMFRNRDSIRSDISDNAQSGPLRTCASQISSKRRVRGKLMRKTFIVLIITITCIIALVLTFCLHIIADDVNNNVVSIPTPQLIAFVIFHRGSFSIICAIFPIVYGIRDQKFRAAFRDMFGCSSSAVPEVVAQECSGPENSECQ